MTKRILPLPPLFPLLSLSLLLGVVGCQSASTMTVAYPAPSFEAPRMALQASAPLAPATPNYPVLPAIPRVAVVPPKHMAPSMAGVPLAWVPPVAPRPWRWIVVHHSDTTTGGAGGV